APFTATSFFDVFVDVDLNGTLYNNLPAVGTETINTPHDNLTSSTTFNTEMTQLDITGPGFLLRESPTLPSTGQTTITDTGGQFHINSFFDIFTEISLDGGATWTPAQSAVH